MSMFLRVLLIILVVPSVCLAATVGHITKLNGTVSVKGAREGGFTAAKARQELQEGDRIRTGKNGWVEVKLVDESRLTLANNTELELTSLNLGLKEKRGVLNLVGGKIRATVTKLAGQQADIKVKSPTAVAGIKGTEFLMLSRGPANLLFGNEGTVAVSGADGGAKVLAPGTMTQTTRGQEPVEAVEVKPDTPLAEAKAAFEEATGAAPPADWTASDNLQNIVARWNIKYSDYLAGTGKYDQALKVLQIALDLTTLPDISADARNARGAIFGRNMNLPAQALEEYLQVMKDQPEMPQAETALYHAGQSLAEMGKKDEAAELLRRYLEKYPQGNFRGSVETILKTLGQQVQETR